ncbi:RDD family protein [Isoptericola croceus]|uniref:RDD family protein n=1 Tax=Isoptericola croceus TaxID=3031406 RepID=UPI0023F6FEF6|nr:RDD family protein [Isoptericola croceus]
MSATTCPACGAEWGPDTFCGVCGTPRNSSQLLFARLEGTTRPELNERTRTELDPGGRAPEGDSRSTSAGVGRRAGAYLLDMLALLGLLLVVAVPVVLATGLGRALSALGDASTPTGTELATADVLSTAAVTTAILGAVALLGLGGLAGWEGRTGATVGNRLLRIQTLDADTHTPIGVPRALLRWLVVLVGGLVPVVGTALVLVSPSFDSSGRRQGWHDKAARTVVVGAVAADPPSFTPSGGRQPVGQTESRAAQVIAASLVGNAVSPQAPVAPQGAPAAAAVISAVPGASPSGLRGPAPPPTPRPTEPGPGVEDLEVTRFSVSSRRSDGVPSLTTGVLSVALDDGRQIRVEGRTLLGRAPQQDQGAPATLLNITCPTRSVSKTHAELVPIDGALLVTDTGSTNGSAVIGPDGAVQELSPGSSRRIEPGWALQVGDRRLTVVPPGTPR